MKPLVIIREDNNQTSRIIQRLMSLLRNTPRGQLLTSRTVATRLNVQHNYLKNHTGHPLLDPFCVRRRGGVGLLWGHPSTVKRYLREQGMT